MICKVVHEEASSKRERAGIVRQIYHLTIKSPALRRGHELSVLGELKL